MKIAYILGLALGLIPHGALAATMTITNPSYASRNTSFNVSAGAKYRNYRILSTSRLRRDSKVIFSMARRHR